MRDLASSSRQVFRELEWGEKTARPGDMLAQSHTVAEDRAGLPPDWAPPQNTFSPKKEIVRVWDGATHYWEEQQLFPRLDYSISKFPTYRNLPDLKASNQNSPNHVILKIIPIAWLVLLSG